jgi:hypothetical protein
MFETSQVIYYIYFYILFVAVFRDIISQTPGKEVYIDVSMFLPCFNSLNAKLNPICHLLALLGAHHILHVSRIRVKVHVVFLF